MEDITPLVPALQARYLLIKCTIRARTV
ncbi:TPA: hypothetical protein N0F65_005231 [Lagenidium giganteum]|uniref:Uncharacterized protein n=1 Tax=Lagenidium giganteum TaxID=4803 RepID=A0AAV2YQR6_9STRA|nr:TPA: hypothetical protein N0F65_005231 [Lagenidium giganteum]